MSHEINYENLQKKLGQITCDWPNFFTTKVFLRMYDIQHACAHAHHEKYAM